MKKGDTVSNNSTNGFLLGFGAGIVAIIFLYLIKNYFVGYISLPSGRDITSASILVLSGMVLPTLLSLIIATATCTGEDRLSHILAAGVIPHLFVAGFFYVGSYAANNMDGLHPRDVAMIKGLFIYGTLTVVAFAVALWSISRPDNYGSRYNKP